jgi:hypothetical protein
MAATPVSSAAGLLRPDLDGVTLEFSLQENMNRFIGLQVMPETPIVMPAAQWRRVKVESLLKKPDHAIRAPRAGFQRDDFEFDIDTVFTREYGVEEYIDEVERMQYSDFFDAEAMATMRAKHRLMMLHEMRVAALSFDEAGFTAAGQFTDVGAGGANRPWNNVATATPRADFRARKLAFKGIFGFEPNVAIMSDETRDDVLATNDFADKWEASGAGDRPMDANERDVARYLEIDRILTGSGAQNTAVEGAAAVYAPIWSNSYVLLARVAQSRDIHEPCFGRTFRWSRFGGPVTGRMESYYEPQTDNSIIRARHYVGEKVIYTKAAWLLKVR